jgi:RNA polymerase sigma factor (sigma-70 family)
VTDVTEPSDAELVRAAQSGDAGSLGMLLQRHRAGMRAAALGVLGYRPEIEDVVQDSCLIALRRLGDLREPQALGGWLRSVVRNQARHHLRARTAVPLPDLNLVLPPAEDIDPARLLEQHALRDWLWHAVNLLSPEQRLVTMLRYFTAVTTYEQIAALCGIPVGTVRSRLSHARVRLAENLTACAELAHGDQLALTQARHREAVQTLEAAQTGRYGEALAAICHPTVEMTWGKGKRTHGLDYPTRSMYRDVADGVSFRLAEVVVGADLLIWETELVSPPEDPFHCPPSAVWVHFLEQGRSSRMRLFHPLAAARP